MAVVSPLGRRLAVHPRFCYQYAHAAGWSSLVARRAHNPKVAGSNPAPAIEADQGVGLARALQTGRLRPRRPPQGGLRRERALAVIRRLLSRYSACPRMVGCNHRAVRSPIVGPTTI